PLFIYLRHAASGHARQSLAAVFARESECAKAAILRSPRKFHGSRYHAAAHFVTEKSGASRKFRPMELLPVHAIHPRFTSSSIIPDIPDEPIRSLETTESRSPPRRQSSCPQARGPAASPQGRNEA